MAGPFTIQRWPWSLGNLMKLQGGVTPSELAPFTQAIVDASPYYKQPTRFVFNGSTNVLNAAGGVFGTTSGDSLVVPPGEMWELESISIQLGAIAAATVYGAAPGIEISSGVREVYNDVRMQKTGTGTNRIQATHMFVPGQRFMFPGEFAGVYIDEYTAGGGNNSCNVVLVGYRYLL